MPKIPPPPNPAHRGGKEHPSFSKPTPRTEAAPIVPNTPPADQPHRRTAINLPAAETSKRKGEMTARRAEGEEPEMTFEQLKRHVERIFQKPEAQLDLGSRIATFSVAPATNETETRTPPDLTKGDRATIARVLKQLERGGVDITNLSEDKFSIEVDARGERHLILNTEYPQDISTQPPPLPDQLSDQHRGEHGETETDKGIAEQVRRDEPDEKGLGKTSTSASSDQPRGTDQPPSRRDVRKSAPPKTPPENAADARTASPATRSREVDDSKKPPPSEPPAQPGSSKKPQRKPSPPKPPTEELQRIRGEFISALEVLHAAVGDEPDSPHLQGLNPDINPVATATTVLRTYAQKLGENPTLHSALLQDLKDLEKRDPVAAQVGRVILSVSYHSQYPYTADSLEEPPSYPPPRDLSEQAIQTPEPQFAKKTAKKAPSPAGTFHRTALRRAREGLVVGLQNLNEVLKSETNEQSPSTTPDTKETTLPHLRTIKTRGTAVKLIKQYTSQNLHTTPSFIQLLFNRLAKLENTDPVAAQVGRAVATILFHEEISPERLAELRRELQPPPTQ